MNYYRGKKGFGVPIGKWFHAQQLSFSQSMSLPLNAHFISEKKAEHIQQQADKRAFLWNIWLLNAWSRG